MIKESANQLPHDHQYNGIDLIKFFCAFLVFIIHIRPFNTECLVLNNLNFWLQNYICRIAVPFYFMTSGFLLFKKMEFTNLNSARTKKYCFKNLRLLGTWTFLLFVGGSGQLWYLGALVLAVIILKSMLKKGVTLHGVLIFSLMAFVIGLLGDSYYGFIEPLKNYKILKILIAGYDEIFLTTRNGLFFGLIFVLIGAIFSQKTIKMNNKVAVSGLLISMMIMLFEVYSLRKFSHPKDYNMVASLIPVAFFLFYIATHLDLKSKQIYNKLRVIGIIVFFSHLFVNYFVKFVLEIIKSKIGIDLFAFNFLPTLLLTLIFAIILERAARTKKFYWVKYLYS